MKLADVNKAVEAFKYNDLFLELGWEIPSTNSFAIPSSETDDFPSFSSKVIARLQSVSVYEVCLEDSDEVPSKKLRHRVAARISETSRENITIFVNKSRSKTVWCWFAKGKTNSTNLREHAYLKGQPGDLFASKILNLYFDFADFDSDGNVALAEVTSRLQTAMDVERVTKKFFNAFTEERLKFVEHISGIDDEKDKAWYASTLLNRLMFIWFLQAKHFLGKPDIKYLENKLSGYDSKKSDYFSTFLQALFFEGFAKKEKDRSANARKLVGEIPYLNGGLFLKNRVELTYPDIKIKNEAFENLFALFGQYSWNLDDTPGGKANEMNPDVLGYIFEKYINQKGFGAYYTPPDITEYMCEQTIQKVLVGKVNDNCAAMGRKTFADYADMMLHLDEASCETLWRELERTTLLDPACGSGAFLVAAMKVLHGTYGAIIGHIQANNYSKLNTLLDQFQEGHATLAYAIKKAIITNNLFGVDIMAEGAEIAKLRLFMTLVATAKTVDQLEPLPNIDFNILSGNSLIGLLSVDYEEFTEHQPMDMFHNDSLTQLMEIKNRNIDAYKAAGQPMEVLEALRDGIREARTEAYETMDRILVEKMGDKKIKYKEITWDIVNNKANKAKLRALTKSDISAEEPFHWGYDFDEVMVRGGFDAIITNPPWDTFQKDEKEFFQEYDGNIGKNVTDQKAFKKIQKKLLSQKQVKTKWEYYCSKFSHLSQWFKNSDDYQAQNVIGPDGKGVMSKSYLQELFIERCFRLLRADGVAGLIIPSSFHIGQSATPLRKLLFENTTVTGLFNFENRKKIFEGVDSRFTFDVLTFKKAGKTDSFPAAFMRQETSELTRFPNEDTVKIQVSDLHLTAPWWLNVIELNSKTDKEICKKLYSQPLLQNSSERNQSIAFSQELNMSTNRNIFTTSENASSIPLYSGGVIWHFDNDFGDLKFWVNKKKGRNKILGRTKDVGQRLSSDSYRLGFRDIASSTNERSLISTIIPPAFNGHKLPTLIVVDENGADIFSKNDQLLLTSFFNSFVLDWVLRNKINASVSFFYVLQLPVPPFAEQSWCKEISSRASKLICTSPEYDELAKAVGLNDHTSGVTDATKRQAIRAEIDAIIAHIYGLTEDEFTHILKTFPIVDQSVKDDTLAAFRRSDLKALVAPSATTTLLSPLAKLLASDDDEGDNAEFKSTFEWCIRQGKKDKGLQKSVLKTIAAFLNSSGGMLAIGVEDDKSIYGLDADYALLSKPDKREWFEQKLVTAITNSIGAEFTNCYTAAYEVHEGKDVMVVTVHERGPVPAYLDIGQDSEFYVRTGRKTIALTARDMGKYISTHW